MADVTPTPAPAPSTIKKIFQAIWAFINSKFIGYAIALVLIIFIAQTCNNLNKAKQAAANAQQNISALTDTLHKEKLKSGALQFSIDGYISDAKGLKTLNKDLSDELANQKGTVISLNKVVMLLMQDTTDLRKYIDLLKAVKEKPVKVNDTTYFVPWTLPYTYDSTNFDLFKGRTKIGLTLIDKSLTNFNFSNVNVLDEGTELLSRMTQMELVWGQKWENGKLRVFANSKYPGFHIVNMDGVLLDVTKKTHWFKGFSLGLSTTYGWNFITQKPSLVVGPSFTWSIYTF